MKNGLTQTELGQIVSVSRQTICAVELEHCDPSIWLAFDIAQLFDMKIEDVFDFTAQIAITSWTPRGKNLGHGWSRRIYP